jgi:hypothetical protein
MIKNSLSLFDDVAFLIVSQASQRAEILKYLKAQGIKEIRGLAIEKRIVTSPDQAANNYDWVWEQAIKNEKEVKK